MVLESSYWLCEQCYEQLDRHNHNIHRDFESSVSPPTNPETSLALPALTMVPNSETENMINDEVDDHVTDSILRASISMSCLGQGGKVYNS